MEFLRRLIAWIKGKRAEPAPPPPARAPAAAAASAGPLLDRLLAAVHSKRWAEVERLYRSEPAAFDAGHATWCVAPNPKDAEETQAYVEGVVALAAFLAEVCDDDRLLATLRTAETDNPLKRWERELVDARKLVEGCAFEDALERLRALRLDISPMAGPARDVFLGLAWNATAGALLHAGRSTEALEPAKLGFKLCVEGGDLGAIMPSGETLLAVHRYRGEWSEASRMCDLLATACRRLGRVGQAERFEREARGLLEGEPLVRACLLRDGLSFELDDAVELGAPLSISTIRNRPALIGCIARCREASRAAREGEFEDALSKLEEARGIDPHDPAPWYLEGQIEMARDRFAEAETRFRRAEQLAPGWRDTRSWLHHAEELSGGRLEADAFRLLCALDRPGEEEGKLAASRHGVENWPDFGALWHAHGRLLVAAGEPAEARRAFSRAIRLLDEPHRKTRLFVDQALILESPVGRRALLEQAVALDGNLLAAATARLLLQLEDEATDGELRITEIP